MGKYVVARQSVSWDKIERAFDSGQPIVPVVDHANRYMGFVRRRDRELFDTAEPSHQDVGRVLRYALAVEPARINFAVHPGDGVSMAMNTMGTFEAAFVPVIDNNQTLLGVAGLSDFVNSVPGRSKSG